MSRYPSQHSRYVEDAFPSHDQVPQHRSGYPAPSAHTSGNMYTSNHACIQSPSPAPPHHSLDNTYGYGPLRTTDDLHQYDPYTAGRLLHAEQNRVGMRPPQHAHAEPSYSALGNRYKDFDNAMYATDPHRRLQNSRVQDYQSQRPGRGIFTPGADAAALAEYQNEQEEQRRRREEEAREAELEEQKRSRARERTGDVHESMMSNTHPRRTRRAKHPSPASRAPRPILPAPSHRTERSRYAPPTTRGPMSIQLAAFPQREWRDSVQPMIQAPISSQAVSSRHDDRFVHTLQEEGVHGARKRFGGARRNLSPRRDDGTHEFINNYRDDGVSSGRAGSVPVDGPVPGKKDFVNRFRQDGMPMYDYEGYDLNVGIPGKPQPPSKAEQGRRLYGRY